MIDENPFRKLKLAAERQDLASIEDTQPAAPETPHPITALIPEATPSNSAAINAESASANDLSAASRVDEAISENFRASDDPEPEVIIEPLSDFNSRPWWDQSHSRSREGFHAPVVVRAVNPQLEDQIEEEREARQFEELRTNHYSNKGVNWDRVLKFMKRPKAFGYGVSGIILLLLGVKVIAGIQTNVTDSQRNADRETALQNTLALLDANIANQAKAMEKPPAIVATNGAASALSANSVDEYVAKAMPQLTGEQPLPSQDRQIPESLLNRPLPSVTPGISALVGPTVTTLPLPKKRPISDRIDDDSPVQSLPMRKHRESKTVASNRLLLSHDAGRSQPGVDPLAGLIIRAEVVDNTIPLTVRRIRQVDGSNQADIALLTGGNIEQFHWTKVGDELPNGWQLIGIDRQSVMFLTPDKRPVNVKALGEVPQ